AGPAAALDSRPASGYEKHAMSRLDGCAPAPPDWPALRDEELLKLRICQLPLAIEGSPLEPRVEQLYAELAAKGIAFRPRCYLGDEWFSPEGVPAIAIPFYLAHPRLMQLEQKMMLEVEGGDPVSCMKLLRHECGHAIDHAYRLAGSRRRKELFGSAERYDPDHYRPRPYSRSFVRHIENFYAQAHPDEDFAETFAVWLTPGLDWRARYRTWKALAKLEYVDELMRTEVIGRPPKVTGGYLACAAARLTSTLERFYRRRKRRYGQAYPDFHDDALHRIFAAEPPGPGAESAVRYLRRHRRAILDAVSRWTGEHKYTISDLLAKLAGRCAQLRLYVRHDEALTAVELASYLSNLVTTYLLTGRFKRTV
ncbi:MAG TPA: putative zinc-binding metallopeptidase, partial [Thermodesulfobacteriota bacterium]|nr:putative zinc-binding metallopeptidase [Thermodesulfobacteriota bacterium]